MPASSCPLEEILPHRPPMVLIDRVTAFDLSARTLTASVCVKEEWRGNWVAIEYMAQTAAALVGLVDKAENRPNVGRPGFLLGTRSLKLAIPEFEVGKTYAVQVHTEFEDDASASFSCVIKDGDTDVATAIISAYRP